MEKDYYSQIGERIKLAREARNLKTCDLADIVGKQDNAVTMWETGRQPIKKIADLLAVADALNVSTDYLLGKTDVMSNNMEMRNAAEYIGASEAVITNLRRLYLNEFESLAADQRFTEARTFFDKVLSNVGFQSLITDCYFLSKTTLPPYEEQSIKDSAKFFEMFGTDPQEEKKRRQAEYLKYRRFLLIESFGQIIDSVIESMKGDGSSND